LLVVASISVPALAIEFSDCEISGTDGTRHLNAQCGILSRPENPHEPDGKHIDLAVAKIPALANEAKEDAFTIINGGPGGSSIELYVDLAQAFEGIRRDRDIYILDQRGTGESNPLNCAELNLETGDSDDLDVIVAAAGKCLAQLNGDPRFYTTSVAVQDLEALRRTLGIPQLNVYGVSYGTRVGLHYLRKFPSKVRTLTIDGVLPPELALGPDIAGNAQNTLDSIFERCAQDGRCVAAYPRLEAEFDELLSRFEASQFSTNIADPKSGQLNTQEVGYGHLAAVVRLFSYAPESASLLPLLIHQASADHDYRMLATQAKRIISYLSQALSIGMHNSVVCTEDAPFYQVNARTQGKDTYLGEVQLDFLESICGVWPQGEIDEDFKSPVISDVPTLILSGEFDPVTPPRYGDAVAENLSQHRHLVAPGQGHGVVGRGCVPAILSAFIDTGNLTELETTCIDQMIWQPFFVNSFGPAR